MKTTAKQGERRKNRFRPTPGRVYRTGDLRQWTANPTRMVRRLTERGELKPLAHGLYAAFQRTKFGEAPPKPEAIMEAFLGGEPYVFTGPEYWNALGLGATALFPVQIVYNTKRTGEFEFGGRRFVLRRCRFPERPTPEWYAVDLIQNRDMMGLDRETLARRLKTAVERGDLNPQALRNIVRKFGTKETERMVDEAIGAAPR